MKGLGGVVDTDDIFIVTNTWYVGFVEVSSGTAEIAEKYGTPEFDNAIRAIFPTLPPGSIDFGVMEKAEHIYTIPGSFGRDGVGSRLAVERINNTNRIFHLAAQSSVAVSWKKPALTAQINVVGVINLLEEVRAYALLAEKGRYGETYNAGSGRAVEIRTVLDMILSLSPADISVMTDAARVRPTDVPVICADIAKITADTGWRPGTDISETIADMLDYRRGKV